MTTKTSTTTSTKTSTRTKTLKKKAQERDARRRRRNKEMALGIIQKDINFYNKKPVVSYVITVYSDGTIKADKLIPEGGEEEQEQEEEVEEEEKEEEEETTIGEIVSKVLEELEEEQK